METEATVSEFQNMLSARGVSRRSFMKLCGAVAVAAGLSELAAPRVAQALEKSVLHQHLEDVLQILFRDLLPGGYFL